jgi:GT2 family glycosyltransferase
VSEAGERTVRVVVVHYGNAELTLRCLRGLAAGSEVGPWPTEVVVVDNDPVPLDTAQVAAISPSARVMRPGANVGFAAGVNAGLRAPGSYAFVALLNNDAVPEPDWLVALVAALEADRDLGAACSKILLEDPPGTINSTGLELVEHGFGADRGYLEPDVGQYDEPVEMFGWCGGAVLLRSRYLADVGLLDERYFAYYEDFDMSWRGRLRGWRYRYVPDSVVHHRHAAGLGVGSERFRFLVSRNRLLSLFKLAPMSMALRAAAVEVKLAFVDGRGAGRRQARILASTVRHLPGVLLDRWRLRHLRRAATRDVLAWVRPRARPPSPSPVVGDGGAASR